MDPFAKKLGHSNLEPSMVSELAQVDAIKCMGPPPPPHISSARQDHGLI